MQNDYFELKKKIKDLEEENTVLKKQQIEINKAKELYLKIFEDFPALIWRSRLDKLCDYFNKTWLDFTGRSFEQEFGYGWAEGVHPDDFDFCVQIYVNAFDKHEAFLMEYRLKNEAGEYRWIRDFGRPFYDLDNTFLGYIGSCYDITEIKNNELKLIELNATKDKFFSIIAHDLRNPFNHILGNVELLIENYDELDDCKRKQFVEKVYSSSKNAFNLLENLLEWSRTQSNTIAFKPEPVNLLYICNEVTENLAPLAAAKNIQVGIVAVPIVNLYSDLNMIKTVLRNLVSNAIKYTNQNGNIDISAEICENNVTITVSDNGVGIDPRHMNHLFDIQDKMPRKGTAGEKGTGLGLIICKEFIEKHKGKIWVESEPGRGSNFKFTIPLSVTKI